MIYLNRNEMDKTRIGSFIFCSFHLKGILARKTIKICNDVNLFSCRKLKKGPFFTSTRQFTFYHSVPRNSWYTFYRPRKDEKLSRPWSHPVVLNTGPLDWESSALTTRPLLQKYSFLICRSASSLYSLLQILVDVVNKFL